MQTHKNIVAKTLKLSKKVITTLRSNVKKKNLTLNNYKKDK